MKMFNAYRLINANQEEPEALIWWDGKTIQSSNAKLLAYVKKLRLPYGTKDKPEIKYSDGESFFKALPLAFRSGYEYLEKTQVDESGKEV